MTVRGLRLDGRNPDDQASPIVNADRAKFVGNNVTNRNTGICFLIGHERFGRAEGTVMMWFKPDWDAQSGFADGLGRILWDLRIEHGSVVPDDPSQRWAIVYPHPIGTRDPSTLQCWRFCVANAFRCSSAMIR